MVRIEIRDFQSIAHEVVEVDGFSALVGRSNIGKSAVVRAIKAALTGAPADSYVRHGVDCPRGTKGAKSCKCFCSVHIVADGFDLLWEKGDTINRYVHNTVEHTVVGRGTPDFLADGFGLVKIGDDKELLQVSDQFHPIFILDKSGTVVADVLSDVAKLDEINVASRLAEKDRKEAAGTRKVRQKDVLELQTAVSLYDGFDDALIRVKSVEEIDVLTEAVAQRLGELEGFVESAYGMVLRIKNLEKIGSVEVPEMEPVVQGGLTLTALLAFDVILQGSLAAVAALAPVEKVNLPEVQTVVQDGSKVLTLDVLAAGLSDKETAVAGLAGVEKIVPPSIEGFEALGTGYLNLVQWALKVTGLREFFTKATAVPEAVPVLEPLVGARDEYLRFCGWAEKLPVVAQSMMQIKEALDAVFQDEADLLREFQDLGVCSTCNQNVTAEHQHG